MAFDETGFSSMFDMMNPQGNPLELGAMLAHQPEGLIPQLAQSGVTPAMFEERFGGGGGFMGGNDLSTGQLLNAGMQLPFGAPVGLTGPEQSAGIGAIDSGTLTPKPVQTVSFQRPAAGPPAQPGVQAATAAPGAIATPAEVPPGYQDPATVAASPAPGATAPSALANPAALNAKAQEQKKVADLVKLLQGVKAPPEPQVQLPRPGTAGPPAIRPIGDSGIAALLQRALAGQKPGPTLGSVVRR